jgi:hypothetical protein
MRPDPVGQSLNISSLQKDVLRLWKSDNDSARELGKALITLRDAMKGTHGDFAAWFRKAGLSENRVYYCIRLVEGKIAKPKEQNEDQNEEDGKEKEQPAIEHLLTPDAWQLLSRHATNQGITPLALAQQICVPAINAWLDAQVPFAASDATQKAAS